MQKHIRALSLSFIFTNLAQIGMAASMAAGTGLELSSRHPTGAGAMVDVPLGNHVLRASSSASDLSFSRTGKTAVLPPLNEGALEATFTAATACAPLAADKLAAAEALRVNDWDLYSIEAIVLAGAISRNPDAYPARTILTPEMLDRLGVSKLFVGWQIAGTQDGINRADNNKFSMDYTGFFGLALDEPATAVRGSRRFRFCAFNAPMARTLKEQLTGHMALLKEGNAHKAFLECRQAINREFEVSEANLTRLGFPYIPEPSGSEAKLENERLTARRQVWIKQCHDAIKDWMCALEPDAVAGNTVPGAIAICVVRGIEIFGEHVARMAEARGDKAAATIAGGDPVAMAKSIQRVWTINASVKAHIIEIVGELLRGQGVSAFKPETTAVATFHNTILPDPTGENRRRKYRSWKRPSDIFGTAGGAIGDTNHLPRQPFMSGYVDDLTRTAREAPITAPIATPATTTSAPARGGSWFSWPFGGGTTAEAPVPAPIQAAPTPAGGGSWWWPFGGGTTAEAPVSAPAPAGGGLWGWFFGGETATENAPAATTTPTVPPAPARWYSWIPGATTLVATFSTATPEITEAGLETILYTATNPMSARWDFLVALHAKRAALRVAASRASGPGEATSRHVDVPEGLSWDEN